MRYIKHALFGISLLMGLASCGGGGGDSSVVEQSPLIATPAPGSGGVAANVTTINGVHVPPDPGVSAKTSIAGVDANGNGVRDEVEREIAAYFGSTGAKHSAALVFARKLQSALVAPITTSAEASESVTSELVAFECFAATLGSREEALTAANVIAARSYNTKARITENARIYDLSGLVELPKPGAASC